MIPKRISIIGSNAADTHLSKKAYSLAKELGATLTKNKYTIICGGKTGVMEAVCKGAKKNHGTTIGILPETDSHHSNPFVDIPIPTGLGHQRNTIIITAGDIIISIGGRWGTLNELTYAFLLKKPTILMKGTGGATDFLINSDFLTNNSHEKISISSSVNEAISFIKKNG